jgi:hypothetical protein
VNIPGGGAFIVGGSPFESVTVNLTEAALQALDKAVTLTGHSKTDAINKALRLYALLHQAQADGGSVYLQESAGAQLERLRVL